MKSDDLIPAEEFCDHYKVEFSFINYLHQFGLIEITTVEETYYIPQVELRKLEQLVRLHYDLNINLEGIDAITHLLDRVNGLQLQITSLKNRLNLYEK
jgi:hypothetical protein